MILKLNYIGNDSHQLPVYECDGRLYVDADPRKHVQPKICTKYKNGFDSEPDTPIYVIDSLKNADLIFVPERITW